MQSIFIRNHEWNLQTIADAISKCGYQHQYSFSYPWHIWKISTFYKYRETSITVSLKKYTNSVDEVEINYQSDDYFIVCNFTNRFKMNLNDYACDSIGNTVRYESLPDKKPLEVLSIPDEYDNKIKCTYDASYIEPIISMIDCEYGNIHLDGLRFMCLALEDRHKKQIILHHYPNLKKTISQLENCRDSNCKYCVNAALKLINDC
jgi:hypothetical protein